jgi:hypothetical protein
LPRKASAEPRGQIGGELVNYLFAVLGLGFSSLLELDYVAANQPVCCRHQRVHTSRRSATRLID